MRKLVIFERLIIVTIVIIINLLSSCGNRDEKKLNRKDIIEQYRKDAILHGDDSAYGSYLEYASGSGLFYDKLSLSLIMNERFENNKSYYEIYKNIIELRNNNKYSAKYLNNLSNIDRTYSLHYLEEGAKKNIATCQGTLESIYRNGYGIERNLKKSDSIYQILELDRTLGEFYKNNKNNKDKLDKFFN